MLWSFWKQKLTGTYDPGHREFGRKMEPKKLGRPPKFSDEENEFIFTSSEGKMTILNNSSSRNIAKSFEDTFKKSISKSHINDILLKKYGKPYRALNTVLLTKDHILQRLNFSNEIIEKGISGSQIMFTDECRIILHLLRLRHLHKVISLSLHRRLQQLPVDVQRPSLVRLD